MHPTGQQAAGEPPPPSWAMTERQPWLGEGGGPPSGVRRDDVIGLSLRSLVAGHVDFVESDPESWSVPVDVVDDAPKEGRQRYAECHAGYDERRTAIRQQSHRPSVDVDRQRCSGRVRAGARPTPARSPAEPG